MRAATSSNGLGIRRADQRPDAAHAERRATRYERVNYNGALESIIVNGGNGDDQFYVDDTRSSITVNGDEGNDFFQIGQLYKSRRTPALAGVAPGGRVRHHRHDAGLAEQRHLQADDDQRRHRRRQLHRLPQPRHARPERRCRQRHVHRPGVRARGLAGGPPRADRPQRRRGAGTTSSTP